MTDGRGQRHLSAAKPELLGQRRQALRSRHDSRRTEQTYCQWVRRHGFFHNVRQPGRSATAIGRFTLW
jgi:hypothetical protein